MSVANRSHANAALYSGAFVAKALPDEGDKSDHGEQCRQRVAYFPFDPIHRPISRKAIRHPAIQGRIDGPVENEEVGEHRDVADCCDQIEAPGAIFVPSHKAQDESRKKRQDFHRPECFSPAAIQMLLDAQPQWAIQSELRNHLNYVRHGRRGSNERDNKINRSQGPHKTNAFKAC